MPKPAAPRGYSYAGSPSVDPLRPELLLREVAPRPPPPPPGRPAPVRPPANTHTAPRPGAPPVQYHYDLIRTAQSPTTLGLGRNPASATAQQRRGFGASPFASSPRLPLYAQSPPANGRPNRAATAPALPAAHAAAAANRFSGAPSAPAGYYSPSAGVPTGQASYLAEAHQTLRNLQGLSLSQVASGAQGSPAPASPAVAPAYGQAAPGGNLSVELDRLFGGGGATKQPHTLPPPPPQATKAQAQARAQVAQAQSQAQAQMQTPPVPAPVSLSQQRTFDANGSRLVVVPMVPPPLPIPEVVAAPGEPAQSVFRGVVAELWRIFTFYTVLLAHAVPPRTAPALPVFPPRPCHL